MTIRTIYEITCSFCDEDSFIHKFTESAITDAGDIPEFCPMCGEATAATLVDNEDWDD
jgi:hypothetical protein